MALSDTLRMLAVSGYTEFESSGLPLSVLFVGHWSGSRAPTNWETDLQGSRKNVGE